MAPRRVLVLIQVGVASPRQTSARPSAKYTAKDTTKAERLRKDEVSKRYILCMCGKCLALRKLLIRVFSEKTEAGAEVCPVSPNKKDRVVKLCLFCWCGKRDLNPYIKDTRPSNVRVCRFRHSRNGFTIIQHIDAFVNSFFSIFLNYFLFS